MDILTKRNSIFQSTIITMLLFTKILHRAEIIIIIIIMDYYFHNNSSWSNYCDRF